MLSREVVSELAPNGVLRAAINMGNFLLVTGKSPSGDPEGVSPDMAREIANRLGVAVKYLPYARPVDWRFRAPSRETLLQDRRTGSFR